MDRSTRPTQYSTGGCSQDASLVTCRTSRLVSGGGRRRQEAALPWVPRPPTPKARGACAPGTRQVAAGKRGCATRPAPQRPALCLPRPCAAGQGAGRCWPAWGRLPPTELGTGAGPRRGFSIWGSIPVPGAAGACMPGRDQGEGHAGGPEGWGCWGWPWRWGSISVAAVGQAESPGLKTIRNRFEFHRSLPGAGRGSRRGLLWGSGPGSSLVGGSGSVSCGRKGGREGACRWEGELDEWKPVLWREQGWGADKQGPSLEEGWARETTRH